jgi:phenylalanyl-tRNA synthetase beta chain
LIHPLPESLALADALTFHAFEVESVENDLLDIKVTPNRGHDCLCHRGIAKELSAILDIPMKNDDLRQRIELGPKTDEVAVEIEDPVLCPRYIAALIHGVTVRQSPDWLQDRLNSIGQRPINNIVDSTNYVMFRLGQPLHAFDANKLEKKDARFKIHVRKARMGETIKTLDAKDYALSDDMQLIVDGNTDIPIGIAGVKGGFGARVSESTTDLIIESANFNGPSVRKAAAALKLRTDASIRYEQELSPTLAMFGMKAVVELIEQVASGELVGYSSDYALAPERKKVAASLKGINGILGSEFSSEQVADSLRRLDLAHLEKGGEFEIHVPFERLDLAIPEDIAEEVGRIIGYGTIEPKQLPHLRKKPHVNANFNSEEEMRERLIEKGYSEVYMSVFAEKGERVVANKVDGVRPFLRTSLKNGLQEAYERNMRNKDLLQLTEVRLFEIGPVWKKGRETTMVATADASGIKEEALSPKEAREYKDLPLSRADRYATFSKYPFIVRDIAMWVPKATTEKEIVDIIVKHAGELLVRLPQKFDEFKKGDRTSFAFRLIFQSFDRTLTDFDANERLESVAKALREKGFEIR